MIIVNRKDFLKLPAGTVYAKYTSLGCFGDISVKEESTGSNDWYQYSLLNGWAGCDNSDDFHSKMLAAETHPFEIRNDFSSCGRDGLYDEDQLFIVYDKQDIDQLIDKLKELSPSNFVDGLE